VVFDGLLKMNKSTLIIMQSFEKRMCSHLATHFYQVLRSHNINIDNIDLFVKGGLEKAKAFGIENKTEVQCFLEYLATNGLDYHLDNSLSRTLDNSLSSTSSKKCPTKNPWLHEMLQRDDLSQLRKIREIKVKASARSYN